MIANFGYGALVITFLVSLYGIGAAIYGGRRNAPTWVESARYAMLLTFPLLTLVAVSIIYLLVTGHYEVQFVHSVTSDSMPGYLKVTALWGGQAGSLVFWCWLMSAFASAVTLRKWERDREFLPWVIVVALVTLTFFLILVLFVENPFERLWQVGGEIVVAMFPPAGANLFTPADGQGLNPLLRHFGMIIHPPMLYLGFVSFVIPYAFAMAALITGRSDDRWIRVTRRWTLVAWLFLSLGLILGMRWAYDVLGWGGYWGWDPVEVAALLPWLVGTPFLHSVMIQEKRGMLKQWNMFLVILTYDAVIFGTFLTRSGVLSSVHAFAQSAIGPLFMIFIIATFLGSLFLLIRRWDELKADVRMTSLLSREALFLLNNLLFLSVFVICSWGILYPIINDALGVVGQAVPSLATVFTGEKKTIGADYYERAAGPLFGALVLLMGIAPLSAWGYSTLKTLGRALWKPALFSLIVMILLVVMGVGGTENWWVLKIYHIPVFVFPAAPFALGLLTLVATVTLYEFWRSAWARARNLKENPLVAFWRLFGRNRRRYGGYIIHLGVVLMSLGIIGIELFQTETQGTLATGERMQLGGYAIQYDEMQIFTTQDGRSVARAVLSVFKDGQRIGALNPRQDIYLESGQSMTIPGVRSSLLDDFYVVLVGWEEITSQGATFKVYHNPLVNWVWIGGFVFILGTIAAAFPEKDPALEKAKAKRRVIAPVEVEAVKSL